MTRRGRLGWLVAITALGALLRFYRLGYQPIWLDEAYTREAAQALSAHGLRAMAQIDGTSPVYTSLAALSAAVGSASGWWLRLPAALAGTAAVAVMYYLVRRMFGQERLALWCALAMALSPFAIWYSQEGRAYSLLILVSMGYVLSSWWALSPAPPEEDASPDGHSAEDEDAAEDDEALPNKDASPDGDAAEDEDAAPQYLRRTIAPAVLSLLGLLTHTTFALVVAAVAFAVLVRRPSWRALLWWGAGQAVALLCYLPWVMANQGEVGRSFSVDSAASSNPVLWTASLLAVLVVGPSLGAPLREVHDVGTMHALTAYPASTALAGLLGLVIAWTLWRLTPALGRRARSLLLIWIFAPIVGLLLGANAVGLGLNRRYAAAVVVPLMILVGVLLERAWTHRRWLVAAAMTLLAFGWSNGNWFYSSDYAKDDLRSAVPVIRSVLGPSDTLLIGNSLALNSLEVYGFTCPDRTLRIWNPAAASLLPQAVAQSRPGRTLVLEYEQWETVPDAQLEAIIAPLGAATQTWQWPGVRMFLLPTQIGLVSGPGLLTDCHS